MSFLYIIFANQPVGWAGQKGWGERRVDSGEQDIAYHSWLLIQCSPHPLGQPVGGLVVRERPRLEGSPIHRRPAEWNK